MSQSKAKLSLDAGKDLNKPTTFNPIFNFGPRATTPSSSSSESKMPIAFPAFPAVSFPQPAAKHNAYYFVDGNIIVQVNNTHFNLHSGILGRYSSKFASMSNPGSPLVLDNVNLVDFVRFLDVVYPSQLGAEPERSSEEWISILKQAHMWQIESLKSAAAKRVAAITMAPAERIKLYRECGLADSHDLLPAFLGLCRRQESISLQESTSLGLETFQKIVSIRESVIRDQVEGVLANLITESFSLNSPEDSGEIAALPASRASPEPGRQDLEDRDIDA